MYPFLQGRRSPSIASPTLFQCVNSEALSLSEQEKGGEFRQEDLALCCKEGKREYFSVSLTSSTSKHNQVQGV